MQATEARAFLARTSVFERANADAVWAALLALDDAAEAASTAARLDWRYHPRGRDNIELVLRHGAAMLPWIASRVRDGVLVNVPWCLGPMLLAIGTPEAFAIVWDLAGYDDTSEMVAWEIQPRREVSADELARAADELRAVWLRTHEAVALPLLAARADAGDERARARLAPPPPLTEDVILARLDAAAEAGEWPLFYYGADGRIEYFALRVIAARGDGDAWGIVFQRLTGSYPSALSIQQFTYGTHVDQAFGDHEDIEQVDWEGEGFHGAVVTAWAEPLALDEGVIDELDVRFGTCVEIGYHPYRVAVMHAYLAARGVRWPAIDGALAALGLAGATTVITSDAFHHVIGYNGREGTPDVPWEILPSESPAMRSLAAALVARDASRFAPGESNLDWRLHAHQVEALDPPWLDARIDGGDGGWLAAAMREAAITCDERGLVPLADARAHLAAHARYEHGAGHRVAGSGDRGHYVQDSDRTWAALLSLADADELARTELVWGMPVRAAARNTALAERYGAGLVAWARRFVVDGALADRPGPGCVRACLLHLGDRSVLELLLELGDAPLLDDWLARDGRIATLVELARDAAATAARAVLRTHALLDDARVRPLAGDALLAELGVSATLSAAHVLARLDRAAALPADSRDHWPRFFENSYPGKSELHGLRLLAAREREGDRWTLILERVSGYSPLRVERFVFGHAPPGHTDGHRDDTDRQVHLELPSVAPDPAMLLTEQPDYWAVREAPSVVPALRGYLADHGGLHPIVTPASELLAHLTDPVIVADTLAFQHLEGRPPTGCEPRPTNAAPSESIAYRSVAAALAARDPSLFEAGAPNTDWRVHARFAIGEG